MSQPPDESAEFRIADHIYGIAAFLGGMANVIMQLSLPPVGYGVYESTVESGRVDRHPFKRLRTTLTYLAVATMGTDAERAAYRAAVDAQHRFVRSTPSSPVRYNAFDRELQLWVAACLYRGYLDILEKFRGGTLDQAIADPLYRHCSRLATTLQVPSAMWPADRTAFEQYWQAGLARAHIDPVIRDYFDGLIDLAMLPRPLRFLCARFHRYLVTGLLPAELRAQLNMTWTPAQQRRFDRFLRLLGAVVVHAPKPIRLLPVNLCLWDLRRRMRTGKPLV
ncbi:oxygenase MpaB family protein [Nocardia sp. NPDC127526]|uniref:oxygenase MpaB family protein n=1 Tax=Nocardia sp. NPDC127526 TaxID=3345393 RepID=UPI0036388AFF